MTEREQTDATSTVEAEAQATADAETARGRADLRRLAIRGSAFEILGFGTSQIIRLGSNIVLTRLMFPEAFGLVALVYILIDGLVLLSDIGIEQAVVQSDRGDDPRFLDTAWTLQVIRGCALWVMALLLTWPMARFYGEPDLLWLVPVGTFSVVLAGLGSTSLFTLRRHLALGRIMLLDLGAQVVAVAVMIPWALINPSVWTLIAGALASYVFKSGVSHMLGMGPRNRFAWDRDAIRSIVQFGKWIFGSSAIYFFNRQGDRVILGRLLGVAELGIYSIAVMLSEAAVTAVGRVTRGVFYPVFSRTRSEGHARLREVYYKARLRLDAVMLTGIGVLATTGSWIIDLLYDERYQAAGWMLEVLSVRIAMQAILSPCEVCLYALGETRWGFFQNLGRVTWLVIGIPIAWSKFGLEGLVWATATSEIPAVLVLWPAFHRAGLLRLSRELLAVAFLASGMALGWALRQWLLPAV